MKVFVVDDDAEMIEFMTALLEAAGHTVSSSVAGTYALSAIPRDKPDCVLTDLMMAQMDGLEMCRELRRHAKLEPTVFVVVSARTDAYWQGRAAEAGAAGYITKPLDADTFVSEVESIVGEAQG